MRFLRPLVVAFFLTELCVLSDRAGAAPTTDPAPNIAGETLNQTAARTGYTVDELRKYFPPVTLDYDTDGLAKERFSPPPPIGVHPRVFFNADDLPDIRRRAKETKAGQILAARIRRECDLGLRADPAESKAKNVVSVKAIYDQLVDGKLPAGLKPYDGDGVRVGNLLTIEAFRTLLDDDHPAATRAAAAFSSYLKLYDARDRARLAAAPTCPVTWRRIKRTSAANATGSSASGLFSRAGRSRRTSK